MVALSLLDMVVQASAIFQNCQAELYTYKCPQEMDTQCCFGAMDVWWLWDPMIMASVAFKICLTESLTRKCLQDFPTLSCYAVMVML
jgi:hypothetical protein